MESGIFASARKLAEDFLQFNDSSVTPFHVVDNCRKKLLSKGFKEIHEDNNWELAIGGKYFVTRNNSSLVAFTVGIKFNTNKTGFKIIASHSDVPCLRLPPVSKMENHQGFNQIAVSTYGGSLWHSWFDRDLTIAGRIIFKNSKNSTIDSRLFHIKRPLFKIPNLAIHLGPAESRGKFEFNKETHLKPIISSTIFEKLFNDPEEKQKNYQGPLEHKHNKQLLSLIREEAQLNEKDKILDLDGFIFDSKQGNFFGMNEEFISSSRIDNLLSTFTALNALIKSGNEYSKDNAFIDVVCFFDHEECGSVSSTGADSTYLLEILRRIFTVLGGKYLKSDDFEKALHHSFIISSDMSHSMNPNYSEKYQQNHKVKFNLGVVLKTNFDQRNSTDGISTSLIREIGEMNDVPIQDFIVKNDAPVRVTIGPILSSKTGIRSVDIGTPQLSMHSIRESAGVLDVLFYDKILKGFFKDFEKIKHNLL